MDRRNFVKGLTSVSVGAAIMPPLVFGLNNSDQLMRLPLTLGNVANNKLTCAHELVSVKGHNGSISKFDKLIIKKGSNCLSFLKHKSRSPEKGSTKLFDHRDVNGSCIALELINTVKDTMEQSGERLTKEDLLLLSKVCHKVYEGHTCCRSKNEQHQVKLMCENFEFNYDNEILYKL